MSEWENRVCAGVLLCLLAVVVFLIYMLETTPSCEDQGKKSVFSHFMPIVQMVDKTPVTQMIPVYNCR